eukprot:4302546-Pyramimonas_sp.AAC.1
MQTVCVTTCAHAHAYLTRQWHDQLPRASRNSKVPGPQAKVARLLRPFKLSKQAGRQICAQFKESDNALLLFERLSI